MTFSKREMGIQGLTSFLKEYASNALSSVALSVFANKTVGVDVSNKLYASAYKQEAKSKNSYLRDFCDLISVMRANNITPVFLFDGDTNHSAKASELVDRKEKLQTTKDTIIALADEIAESHGDGCALAIDQDQSQTQPTDVAFLKAREYVLRKGTEEQKKIAYRYISIKQEMYANLELLFKYSGCEYYYAREEADFLAAGLCHTLRMDAVMSEDTDMLTHGVPFLIKGMNTLEYRKTGAVTVISRTDVLTTLILTDEQFTDLCILAGCDYCKKLPGVSIRTGYKLLQKHRDIETILSLPPYDAHVEAFDYTVARNMFSIKEIPEYHKHAMDYDSLKGFIVNNINYKDKTLWSVLSLMTMKKHIPLVIRT